MTDDQIVAAERAQDKRILVAAAVERIQDLEAAKCERGALVCALNDECRRLGDHYAALPDPTTTEARARMLIAKAAIAVRKEAIDVYSATERELAAARQRLIAIRDHDQF